MTRFFCFLIYLFLFFCFLLPGGVLFSLLILFLCTCSVVWSLLFLRLSTLRRQVIAGSSFIESLQKESGLSKNDINIIYHNYSLSKVYQYICFAIYNFFSIC